MKKRAFICFLTFILLLSLVFPAVSVSAAGNMTASEDCIAILKKVEGFSKYPYFDYGQYTVGYGSQCPTDDLGRYRSQGITEKEADELLRKNLEIMENRLNRFASSNNLTLAQNQYDALLMFTYNLGTGWLSGTSDLKTGILTGATGNDLIFYLSRWCTADYQVVPGLVRRRLAEADLFLNGNYSTNGPSYYSYVSFDPNEGVCTSRVQGYDASDPPAIKATPTRTGYRFLGWYTTLENGEWVTDLDTTTEEITLYARWQEGDGIVVNGVIQGTPCNYKRKVISTDKLSVYQAPNEATPFAQLDAGITVKIVADYVDSAGAKWGKMEGGGWINLGTTLQIVKPAAKTIRENVTVTVTEPYVNVRSDAGTAYNAVGKVHQGDRLVISETKMVGQTKWGCYSGGWLSLDYTDYYTVCSGSTNSGSASTVTGTVVNCTSLRIRSGPGTNYPSVGSLKAGEKVEVSDTKTVGAAIWGKISSGWICLSYVKLDQVEAAPPETQPPAEQAPTEDESKENDSDAQQGIVINCNTLNVRSSAGISSKLVDSLANGTKVEIYETTTADGMQWGRIKQGWVCMQYIQPVYQGDSQGQAGTVISTTALNVRASASVASARVASLPSGSRVTVYETTTAGGMTWGRISQGWVCMNYIRLDSRNEGSVENDSASENTSSGATATETLYGKVSGTYSLRIRSGAGTNHTQVGSLTMGTLVQIYETTVVDGVKWGRIDRGWICMSYVKLGNAAVGTLGTVRADSLNIRSAPGIMNPVVGSYKQGTQVEILEFTTVNGIKWGRTNQGWISMNYVKQ